MSRKGFTLIETLLALSVSLLMVFNCTAVLSIMKMPVKDHQEDIALGMKQAGEYLLGCEVEMSASQLNYTSRDGKAFTLRLDNHRLIKSPGYETLIYDVDGLVFSARADYVYATVTRDSVSRSYLIADLYKRTVPYETGAEGEEAHDETAQTP